MPTHANTVAIDAMTRPNALKTMLASHRDGIDAVTAALPAIDAGAGLMAATIRAGGTLYYAAAGSSGLMALADASELAGTFRIPLNQIRICMAGGVPADAHMPGDTEDDVTEAQEAACNVSAADLVIAVSASGTTPYVLAFAQSARDRNAKIVAVSNAQAPALTSLADVAIDLRTAPEVVSGSTRLAAATAQKVALNMISTQAGILLGHVHDGMMVNLNPENTKLRKRATTIVCKVAEVDAQRAEAALQASGYDTKQAILIAAGADVDRAKALLTTYAGTLRDCLSHVKQTTN
jgi:N-acetylmuramic acid 6-phosphate etherase